MVTRLDLDGTYSPAGLVGKILKVEPDLRIPVPIEDLASQLDIGGIEQLKTEGFLGGLITDEVRSSGFILVKAGLGEARRRFTIAHELGHFLIPFHKLSSEEGFLCDRSAMKRWDIKAQKKAWRMEAEANRFASLILMPPPKLKPFIEAKRYASVTTVLDIHREFGVSKEAAARAYTEYQHEVVAVLIVHNQKFQYAYCHPQFPRLDLKRGDPIPEISRLYQRGGHGKPTDSDPTDAAYWISEEQLSSTNALYEQILPQANGFAMIHLKALLRDEEEIDYEEDLTSKQRLARRMNRWS